MIKKSISVTDHQNDWIKTQIKTGHFGNESEVIRELIRERQNLGGSATSQAEIYY
ncbi:MAG: type II toxin-antitoxin system ParD family antitoxin [Thiohalomonadales bacterium]